MSQMIQGGPGEGAVMTGAGGGGRAEEPLWLESEGQVGQREHLDKQASLGWDCGKAVGRRGHITQDRREQGKRRHGGNQEWIH